MNLYELLKSIEVKDLENTSKDDFGKIRGRLYDVIAEHISPYLSCLNMEIYEQFKIINKLVEDIIDNFDFKC